MRVDRFDFSLPDALIATSPAEPRDSARMLHVGPALTDHIVRDLPTLLQDGDILVCNNTKVIPARLQGQRDTTSVELTLHKPLSETRWSAFAKPARKLKEGDSITIADDFSISVVEKYDGGEICIELCCDAAEMYVKLEQYGTMPLPPYIAGKRAVAEEDKSHYQTMFAKEAGAVAAPTAGLHFTEELCSALKARGIEQQEITLHVGGGTFLPVKVEDTNEHSMHSEWLTISHDTAEFLTKAKKQGRRIVAVGTTSMRALESAATEEGEIRPFTGDTDIFITPGYRFKAVDVLMTNFHLPRSTLFMLVSAFAGLSTMHAAYQHAIDVGYRFYSYGDACLLEKQDGTDL